MGKGKKEVNPADKHRKEQRKKELAKAKKDRQVVKEVKDLLNDPSKIDEEIKKAERIATENKLDKSYRERVRELQRMKEVALKKQLVMVAAGKKTKEEAQRSIFEDEEDREFSSNASSAIASSSAAVQRQQRPQQLLQTATRPEDSVYYHPLYNPTGAPPPGALPMYRPSSIAMQPSHPHQALLVGGMNGVPPPPPRPMPVAPVGQHQALLVGGMSGVPPPPPRPMPVAPVGQHQAILVGGMNGVPLPPPRGPYTGIDSSGQRGQQERKKKPPKQRISAQVADPLDPAATGYTERFASQEYYDSLKRLPASSVSDEPHEVKFVSAESIVTAAEQGNASKIGEEKNAENIEHSATTINTTDADTQNVTSSSKSLAEDPSSGIGPVVLETTVLGPVAEAAEEWERTTQSLPTAEELLKRRMLTCNEVSDSTDFSGPIAGPSVDNYVETTVPGPVAIAAEEWERTTQSLPTAEELLKRRMLTCNEVSDSMDFSGSVAEPSFDEHQGISYRDIPATEDLMKRRFQIPSMDQANEVQDESQVCRFEETLNPAPAVKDYLMQSQSVETDKSAPIITKPPQKLRLEDFAPPDAAPSIGLSLLGSYAMDDSDEEDDVDVPEPQHLSVGQQQQQQQQLIDEQNLYPAQLPSNFTSLPIARDEKTVRNDSLQNSDQPIVSGQVKGPKLMRPDAELTAFKPTVLKTKRPFSSVHSRTTNSNDVSFGEEQVRKATRTTSSTEADMKSNDKGNSVDHAYQQFFEEMKQLGAL